MSKKRMNILYGEKYGDPNEPKTAWKRVGTLFIDDEKGTMSIKLDMVPVSKHFDGWLGVFEPREDEGQRASGQSPKAKAAASKPVDVGDGDPEEPINLDDIPF